MFDKLVKIITDKTDINKNEINLSSNFELDLYLDSLDMIEILMEIEMVFNINEVPDEEAEKWKTVQDVINYLKGLELNNE